MADDSGYGAGYGSYLNFFLPKGAQVGGPSLVPAPSLYDLLGGNLTSSMAGGSQSGTPEDQKKRQEQQKQMSGLAQQGVKMMQPTQPQQPQVAPVPVAPQQIQPLPQATQVAPDQPPPKPVPAQAGMAYDPRDPRSRNPIAGMPTPFGGFYR